MGVTFSTTKNSPYDLCSMTSSTFPGVLLASYTWAQDARRIGALDHGPLSKAEDILKELVLDNLCKLHGFLRSKLPPLEGFYVFDWYRDPYTRGEFALYGPGQFGYASPTGQVEPHPPSMFSALKAPAANGKLHFAGEATSAHHAWVLGSLNSAWRAVYNALEGYPLLQADLIDSEAFQMKRPKSILSCFRYLLVSMPCK